MGRAGAFMYLNTNLDLEKYEDEEEPKPKHGVGVHDRKLYLKKVLWLASPPHPALLLELYMNCVTQLKLYTGDQSQKKRKLSG